MTSIYSSNYPFSKIKLRRCLVAEQAEGLTTDSTVRRYRAGDATDSIQDEFHCPVTVSDMGKDTAARHGLLIHREPQRHREYGRLHTRVKTTKDH